MSTDVKKILLCCCLSIVPGFPFGEVDSEEAGLDEHVRAGGDEVVGEQASERGGHRHGHQGHLQHPTGGVWNTRKNSASSQQLLSNRK